MRNVPFQLELKDHMKQFTIKNTSADRVNSVNLGNLPFLYPTLKFDLKGQFTRIGKNSLTHARRSCEVCRQFH